MIITGSPAEMVPLLKSHHVSDARYDQGRDPRLTHPRLRRIWWTWFSILGNPTQCRFALWDWGPSLSFHRMVRKPVIKLGVCLFFFPWSWLEDSCFFTWWNCYHVENGFWFPSNDTCASLPRGCRWLPPGRKDIVCPLQWNSNRDATLVSCVFSAPGCFKIFWENPHYLFRYFYIYIYVYIYISIYILYHEIANYPPQNYPPQIMKNY